MPCSDSLISVIIPAYNAAGFLADAVASIHRQNIEPIEVVIVDDGSTDDTARVAQGLDGRIVFRQQTNAGAAVARNTALAAATGSIIAFLDADDVWPDDKLSLQLPLLRNDASLGVVQGRSQAEVLDDALDSDHAPKFIPFGEPWHAPLLGSGLFQRWVIDRVGGFDPEIPLAEDVDWFLRLREQGVSGVLLSQVTLCYRLHGSNATRGADPKARNLLLALRRSLQRRREKSGGSATPVAHWKLRESAS